MGAPAELTSAAVRETMTRFRDALRSHQEVINRLNVYPVPDGDTGTNMMLTVDSVVTELESLDPAASMAEVCQAVTHGSLMGARGNSGVILSQLLRGLCDRFSTAASVGATEVAGALVEAAALARRQQIHDAFLRVALTGGGLARLSGELAEHLGR